MLLYGITFLIPHFSFYLTLSPYLFSSIFLQTFSSAWLNNLSTLWPVLADTSKYSNEYYEANSLASSSETSLSFYRTYFQLSKLIYSHFYLYGWWHQWIPPNLQMNFYLTHRTTQSKKLISMAFHFCFLRANDCQE